VLKGVPADQVIPTMQFISAALGVECEFCHVERAFDKDDKQNKKFARGMMRMTASINKDNFEGHKEVTCNTCHRGAPKPVSVPAVADENFKPPMEANAERPPVLPNPTEVLDRYVAAIGGKAVIGKLNSLSQKGNLLAGGKQTPIEIATKAVGGKADMAEHHGSHRPVPPRDLQPATGAAGSVANDMDMHVDGSGRVCFDWAGRW